MKSKSVAIRDVEIRTWPQRTDLLVIDPYQAQVIAYFPCLEPAPGKVADFSCGYDSRAKRALLQVSCDQEYLQKHFILQEEVQLRAISDVRELLEAILQDYDLSLDKIEMPQLRAALKSLSQLPNEKLYTFLCDWHDIVELHLPGGSSAEDPGAWVWRAHPDKGCHFHYLATGLEKDVSNEQDHKEAYKMFKHLVDVPLRHFSFGHALRWLYFSKTEFADQEEFELRALKEAGY
jgi:hypothetical protein